LLKVYYQFRKIRWYRYPYRWYRQGIAESWISLSLPRKWN